MIGGLLMLGAFLVALAIAAKMADWGESATDFFYPEETTRERLSSPDDRLIDFDKALRSTGRSARRGQ